MAEAQLQIFLEKVRQLNAFVALSEADPQLRRELSDCEHHDEVVALARRCGFEIGRRWGDPPPADTPPAAELLPGPALPQARPEPLQTSRQRASLPRPATDGSATGLLDGPCPAAGEERSEVLLQTPHGRLERIHSCAAVSPAGFWYEQPEHEWVTLLQGSGRLRFEDEAHDRTLRTGDALLIEAGRRHRVTATDGPPGTIWLALFWPRA